MKPFSDDDLARSLGAADGCHESGSTRQDWGLRWNQALETGGVLVANKVRVEGELQFVKQDD